VNGYVEAGYVVGLGTLAAYAASLVVRERAARRRVGAGTPTVTRPRQVRAPGDAGSTDTRPLPGSGPALDPAPGDSR
jgi:hypothetical protein